ncbi:MAG: hypothetical protein V4501_11185 [Pseudomonadota bacterium]
MQNANDILEFPPLDFELKKSPAWQSFDGPSAEVPWPYATSKPPLLEPPTYSDLRQPKPHVPSGGWAAFFQEQVDRVTSDSIKPVKEFQHG